MQTTYLPYFKNYVDQQYWWRKGLFLLILFFNVSPHVFSQLEIAHLKTYTVKDGLSINNVKKLFKDKDSYLWIGTANGLNHFDGKSFTTIPQGNNEGQILGCKILAMFPLNDTTIIMGTDMGISTIDIHSFETKNIKFRIPDGKSNQENYVVEMIPSKAGGFWVITLSEFLFINQHLQITTRFFLPNSQNQSFHHLISPRMVELDNGNLLFMNLQNVNINANNKIYEFNKYTNELKERSFPFLKTTKRFSGLTRVNDDLLLFIEDTPQKINTFIWNENDQSVFEVPFEGIADPYFYLLIFPYDEKQIAISIFNTDHYYVLDESYQCWQKISKGLLKGQLFVMQKLKIDVNTTFWVGAYGISKVNGVSKSKYMRFYDNTKSYIDWNNLTTPFYANDSTEVFVDIAKQLLFFYPKSEKWDTINQRVLLGEKGNILKEACKLDNDHLFLSTLEGIRVFNIKTKQITTMHGYVNKPDRFDKDNFAHYVSKNGDIFLKFVDDNAFYWIDNNSKKVTKLNHPLIDREFYAIYCEDKFHNLFLTHPRMNSILVMDGKTHTFSKIYPDQSTNRLFSNVTSMACDANNNVWLFTNGYGVICLSAKNHEILHQYTTNNGLSNNYVVEKLVDKNGNFIVKTIKNVHLIDPIANTITNINADYPPSMGYGLTIMDPSRTYILFDRNGTNVVLHADSLVAKRDKKDIDVFWAEWKGEFLKIPKNKSIVLDQHYNSIILFFRSINFKDGEDNKYFYRLPPYQVDWVEIINTNKINLNHIGLGHNRLDIKLCYNNGQCIEQSCLDIYIKPYIWQQWWFWVSLFTLVFGILVKYLLSEFEKRKIVLEKTEAEIQLLQSKLNPHFIYNALNSINRYILMSEKLNASEYLSKFAKLMRFTLDHSNKVLIPINQEIESLQIYLELESLRFQQKIEFTIHVDPTIATEQNKMPPMMIQPFVENAIWHGLMPKQGPCTLQILFSKHQQDLQIVVEDNGVGRPQNHENQLPKLKSSEGIRMTQKRIEALSTYLGAQGQITILDLKNDEGKALGTRVTLYFKNILKQ